MTLTNRRKVIPLSATAAGALYPAVTKTYPSRSGANALHAEEEERQRQGACSCASPFQRSLHHPAAHSKNGLYAPTQSAQHAALLPVVRRPDMRLQQLVAPFFPGPNWALNISLPTRYQSRSSPLAPAGSGHAGDRPVLPSGEPDDHCRTSMSALSFPQVPSLPFNFFYSRREMCRITWNQNSGGAEGRAADPWV